MGRHLVGELSRRGVKSFCVNRGKTYWNTESNPAVRADRFRDRSTYREAVRNLVLSSKHRWLGVVDFCAYEVEDIRDSLPREIFDIMPIYVFISTDSVYEVFDEIGAQVRVDETITSDESAAVTPSRDEYGWNKLLCEKYLYENKGEYCRPIFLRLPDVLGTYDDTLRLWALWLWIESGFPMKLENPKQIVSFCAAEDVAVVIVKCLTIPEVPSGPFNIACDEDQWTMTEFVKEMGCGLGIGRGRFMRLLPSVDHRNAPLDCSKARKYLEFKPTPLREVIEKCIEWFDCAKDEFHKQFEECLCKLPRQVRSEYCHKMGLSTPSSSSDSD